MAFAHALSDTRFVMTELTHEKQEWMARSSRGRRGIGMGGGSDGWLEHSESQAQGQLFDGQLDGVSQLRFG